MSDRFCFFTLLPIPNNRKEFWKFNLTRLVIINQLYHCQDFLNIFWKTHSDQRVLQLFPSDLTRTIFIQWCETIPYLLYLTVLFSKKNRLTHLKSQVGELFLFSLATFSYHWIAINLSCLQASLSEFTYLLKFSLQAHVQVLTNHYI